MNIYTSTYKSYKNYIKTAEDFILIADITDIIIDLDHNKKLQEEDRRKIRALLGELHYRLIK